MWQYCKWCKTYYNKLGSTCPHCFITFTPDSSSLPDKGMQSELNRIWNEYLKFRGSELYIPTIEQNTHD